MHAVKQLSRGRELLLATMSVRLHRWLKIIALTAASDPDAAQESSGTRPTTGSHLHIPATAASKFLSSPEHSPSASLSGASPTLPCFAAAWMKACAWRMALAGAGHSASDVGVMAWTDCCSLPSLQPTASARARLQWHCVVVKGLHSSSLFAIEYMHEPANSTPYMLQALQSDMQTRQRCQVRARSKQCFRDFSPCQGNEC